MIAFLSLPFTSLFCKKSAFFLSLFQNLFWLKRKSPLITDVSILSSSVNIITKDKYKGFNLNNGATDYIIWSLIWKDNGMRKILVSRRPFDDRRHDRRWSDLYWPQLISSYLSPALDRSRCDEDRLASRKSKAHCRCCGVGVQFSFFRLS